MTQYPVFHLKKSDVKYDWYELIEDCQVSDDLIIPVGFTTDFASVPQVFWAIIPPHCKASMPSIVHDYICENKLFSRYECDCLFLNLLLEAGVPKWQAWLMFGFVRALGWSVFGKGAK